MRLFVTAKNAGGAILALDLADSSNIAEVKVIVMEKIGFAAEEQDLFLEG